MVLWTQYCEGKTFLSVTCLREQTLEPTTFTPSSAKLRSPRRPSTAGRMAEAMALQADLSDLCGKVWLLKP
jgi:hypothetical protein